MHITLTPNQVKFAEGVAEGRRDQNTLRRRATNDTSYRPNVASELQGVIGEVSAMAMLGVIPEYEKLVIPWEKFGQIKDQVADISSDIEIKCIKNPNYNLIHEAIGLRSDKINKRFILIHWDEPNNVCSALGWCLGSDFKQKGAYVDMGREDRPPFWKIDKKHLKDMSTFITKGTII